MGFNGMSIDAYPAWSDAPLALKYIMKGKARGSRAALWIRQLSQRYTGQVGKYAGNKSGLIIIISIVSLVVCCIGVQQVTLDTTLDSLWTPDSGRLHKELQYVNTSKTSGLTVDTNEMLIQTPRKDGHRAILTAKALLEHLEVLQKALKVTVDMYDLTWSLKDLCYAPNIPTFDMQLVDQILEQIFPCSLITPLDCFWEGSKLLGPDYPIQVPGFRGVKWTTLNPEQLLKFSKKMISSGTLNLQGFPFEILEGLMKRAGIGSGYQEKPCLDPNDPQCPITAPNKDSANPPDVGAVLSQGCYGFAPRYMHWPPEIIVGGQVRNKSGTLTKAGGLMSTIQLMSSQELYDFSKETWRLHGIQDWDERKAKDVLTAWQSRFASEIERLSLGDHVSGQYQFYSFTAAGLDSVVAAASQFSLVWCAIRVAGIIGTMIGFAVLANTSDMSNWKQRVGLLFIGSVIAVLGTAAGSGLSGYLAIPFNLATVQVLPYLAISVGSQVFFLLLFSQLDTGCDAKDTLKRHGFSILVGVGAVAIFTGSGGWFPIPAVRSLALQGAIFVVISSTALMIVFPAVCHFVLKKIQQNRPSSSSINNNAPPPAYTTVVPFISVESFNESRSTRLQYPTQSSSSSCPPSYSSRNHRNENNVDLEAGMNDEIKKLKKNWMDIYFLILSWKWYTGFISILYFAWMIFSCHGITKLRVGLPITDVVPSNSSEWRFLTAQMDLFPVHHIRAITKANFDYPNNQKLLHKFHETISSLPWVVRDDNGGKPPMWLPVFRKWLLRLQRIFDDEWKQGFLNKETWTSNASADGILAWKLAVQTGHSEHPVDPTQLPANRLVDNEGVINPSAFYVYLSAWAWNDPFAYGSTAANLRPEPRIWIHLPEEPEAKIPKSSPIKYAEISYTLKTSRDDSHDAESQVLSFVKEIRGICSSFESRGLPVFPWGIPFRYYEQYLNLPFDSAIVIGLGSLCVFLMLFMCLGVSIRPVAVIISLAFMTALQLTGLVGWFGLGMNSLPVEIILIGIGFIVFASIQFVVAFCCIPGGIVDRRIKAFTLIGPPSVQSLLANSFTALILYSPDFTFIFTHFSLLISLASFFALLNFLFLLPIIVSIFQPESWLIGTGTEDPTILLPLTPSPHPRRRSSRNSHRTSSNSARSSSLYNSSNISNSRRNPPTYATVRGVHSNRSGRHFRAPSENSLSTITEEPNSLDTSRRSAAEIVVQPQVLVETYDLGGNNDPNSSIPVPPTTKTKVSAKFKVEVHSSIHSGNPAQSSVVHGTGQSGTSVSSNSGTSSTSSSTSSSSSSFE